MQSQGQKVVEFLKGLREWVKNEVPGRQLTVCFDQSNGMTKLIVWDEETKWLEEVEYLNAYEINNLSIMAGDVVSMVAQIELFLERFEA